jgi:hypothetical protein
MHRRQFCQEGMLMSSVHDPSINPMVGKCVDTTVVSVQQDHHGAACTLSNSRLQCDAAADAVPHMVFYEFPNCTGAQYSFPVEQCTAQVRTFLLTPLWLRAVRNASNPQPPP